MRTRSEPEPQQPQAAPAVAPRVAPAVATVLALQRSAGNASVGRLLARFTGGVATPTFSGSKARPMLKGGSTDPHVVELQTMINSAGFALAVTGTFDGPTKQAVISFQSKNGLNSDCIVGPLTWGALDRVTGTPSGANTPDQHEGAHLPTAEEQAKVQTLLSPARGKDDTAWDGHGDSPEAASNRTSLRTNMHLAMRVALDEIMVKVEGWAAAPRMDIAKLEPTGKEAKRLADDQFKPLVAAAARTSSQESGLAAFDYTAGVNLFDAADTKTRPPDAIQAAAFIALSDPSCKALVREHHLDRDRTQEENDFFFEQVVDPFAAAHKEPLDKYDQFGFSKAKSGQVFAQTTLDDPEFPHKESAPGEPTFAERHLQWKMLHTLVHEYIHLLEHPTFEQAREGNDVMREGFCEMFTKDVMVPVTAAAKAGDPKIRIGVEGGDFPKGFSPALIPDYAPAKQYAEFVANAEGIRATVGDASVKAAFFQGHVELLGLTPQGTKAAPAAAGTEDLVRVPPVVHTPMGLAVMTGSSPDAIIAANPGLPPKGPLPAKLHVPGCRYHRVVETSDEATGERVAESTEQIATQNGVTVADLERANPGLNRRVPKAGEELLIPLRA